MRKISVLLISFLMTFNVMSQESLFGNNNAGLFGDTSEPLSAAEAFDTSYNIHNKNLKINFVIKPKHYLYNHKLKLSINNKNIDFNISNKTSKIDAHYGEIEAIYDFLNINYDNVDEIETFKFEYQGCSEEFNICYPMQSIKYTLPKKKKLINESSKVVITKALTEEPIKEIEAPIEVKEAPIEVKEPIKETVAHIEGTVEGREIELPMKEFESENKIIEKEKSIFSKFLDIDELKKTLEGNEFMITIGIFFIAGILISFTPCVLPMIPIISSIVIGSKKETSQTKAFLLSFSYVLGSSITYAILGAIAAFFSKNIQIYMQNPYVISTFSLMLVIFSLSLFGLFEIRLPQKLTNKSAEASNKLSGGKYVSVFFMGMLSTLIVSPCVAAPLAAAITYISAQGDVFLGSLSLFSFGMGIGLVLILITTILNKVRLTNGTLMTEAKNFSGMLILIVAVYLLERVLPVNIITYLYQIIFLSYVINVYARNQSKLKHMFLLVVLGLSTVIYINNSVDINNFVLQKESNIPTVIINKSIKKEAKLTYIEINNVKDIEVKNKYAIIKVTADWCTYCKDMEKNIFKDNEIIKKLSDYQMFVLDITKMTKDKEFIMKQMNISAPPALFFFKDKTIIHKENKGIDKERMIKILNKIQ
jgi:thiol:disulfide interchange protein DsbD